MQISDINPKDVVQLKKGKRMISDLDGKLLYVDHIKLNDSFPGMVIKWTSKFGGVQTTVLHADDVVLCEHDSENDLRWRWIAKQKDISDSWSIYNAYIAKNPRYKFLWQRWNEDGYYHCPFCNAKLNTVESIEETFTEDVKECNCKKWKARENKYNEYLKLLERADKLKQEIIGTAKDPKPMSYAAISDQDDLLKELENN